MLTEQGQTMPECRESAPQEAETKSAGGSRRSGAAGKIARIVCFAVLAALMVNGIYQVLRWKDTAGNYLSSVDELYNTGDGLIDVAFIGSSHAYAGIYPAVLWEDYGISSFNLAVSGQDKDSAYHMLVELEKTQDPAVVFVDLYALTFERHAVEGNVYRNLLSMHTSGNSVSLVTDYADEEDWQDLILRWPIIHTRYQELEEEDFTGYAVNSFGRGALYSWTYNALYAEAYYEMLGETAEEAAAAEDDAAGTDADTAAASDTELSESNREWLDKMVALSQEEGFTLVFTILPHVWAEGDGEVYEAVKAYAEEKGIDVLDFARLSADGELEAAVGSSYDLGMDFSDNGHLSGFGAVKTTQYLGSYLEAFSLADHRGDAAYSVWDMDDRWFVQGKFLYAMSMAQSLDAYCELLAETIDLTAVISLEGDYGDGYYASLALLGMSEEEYRNGGKWLYQNGTLTLLMTNDAGEEAYTRDLGTYDTLRVQYAGDYEEGNIMVGMTDYTNTTALKIIVYDEIEETVTQVRQY